MVPTFSHESCAYAGHLGLGKLIAFYDDNGITTDGHTELSFTEDVGKRYEAYGWQVLTVEDGSTDVDAIRKAIAAAKACTDKPTHQGQDRHWLQLTQQGRQRVRGARLGLRRLPQACC